MGGKMMDFAELVQIGMNNIIICKANGRQMSIYELRMIDQFTKTAYVSLRLQELTIQRELDHYEETGRYQDEEPLSDPEITSNGDNTPRPKV